MNKNEIEIEIGHDAYIKLCSYLYLENSMVAGQWNEYLHKTHQCRFNEFFTKLVFDNEESLTWWILQDIC